MGSPDTERSRWSDEGPVHTVNIGYAFYMGKYEVTQARFYFGDSLGVNDDCEDDGIRSQYMWYCDNSTPSGSKPVGGKLPNAFRLYDMSGNLWEWRQDRWRSDYTGAPTDGSAWESNPAYSTRVLRGGSWSNNAPYCRAADRNYLTPDYRLYFVGFRVVCAVGAN